MASLIILVGDGTTNFGTLRVMMLVPEMTNFCLKSKIDNPFLVQRGALWKMVVCGE
jgi:hypothetical protein